MVTVSVRIVEERRLPADLQVRVDSAVQQCLASMFHFPNVWSRDEKLLQIPAELWPQKDTFTVQQWVCIERQARLAAEREIADYYSGQAFTIKFKLEDAARAYTVARPDWKRDLRGTH